MTSAAPTAHEETVHGTGHEHPSDWLYVKVAIVLAVITAAEVVTFYVEDELGAALVPILIVMMVVKFAIVAMWFMHLKFDSRLFSRLFVAGVVLAVAVYIAALVSFQYFGGEPDYVDDNLEEVAPPRPAG